MSDTTVITVPDDTPPAPVIVTAPASEPENIAGVAEAVGDAIARADEADAVGELVADERAAQLERENAELKARLAFDEGVRAGEATAAVATDVEPEIVVDDEVIAPQTHAWFRPMNEWRDK